MPRALFDLEDTLDVEPSLLLDILHVFGGNNIQLSVGLAYEDFDIEPFVVLVLVRPDLCHSFARISFYHASV